MGVFLKYLGILGARDSRPPICDGLFIYLLQTGRELVPTYIYTYMHEAAMIKGKESGRTHQMHGCEIRNNLLLLLCRVQTRKAKIDFCAALRY